MNGSRKEGLSLGYNIFRLYRRVNRAWGEKGKIKSVILPPFVPSRVTRIP